MKYILYCLLLIKLVSNPLLANAQLDTQSEIDSLTQVLSKTKVIAEKKELLTTLSNRYQDKGNWEKYEEVVQQMLLLQEEKEDSFYLAETYNKLGISNSCMGKTPEALAYFKKALEINLAQKMDLIAANSYENMGTVYKDLGDYENAFDCLLKSVEIRKAKNQTRIFNSYLKLAVVQQLIGDSQKEDFYIGLAKQEMYKMDSVSPRNKVLFYNQLGNIYNQQNQYDSCLVFYKNVIDYSKQIGWMLGIAEGIGNMADVYYSIGAVDSSIFYHKQSLKLSQEIADCSGVSEENLFLARLYQELGKKDSVLLFAKEALLKAEECDLLNQQNNVLKFIADYYNSKRDFEQAYIFLQRHYTIEDSISSADIKKNIAELETKYETKVKEQTIELLTTENQLKNQRMNTAIAIVFVLLVVIVLILYILNIRKKQAALIQTDLQQQVLRTQMNPHFIFNVLGSIQNFMMQNDTRKASNFLSQFASLTRATLNNSAAETISLADEIAMLKNYIELEKMRSKDKFDFEINYDDNLEVDFIQIPPMLIQPFIENSIKHGFKTLNKNGLLKLNISDKLDSVEFVVEDNGQGFQKNAKKENDHKSMAMIIFHKRRKLIQQKYNKDFKFTITNLIDLNPEQTGVRISINIPILNND